MPTLAEIKAKLDERGIYVEDTSSVMDKRGSNLEEFKKFLESSFKGGATGLIKYFGGNLGDLYDAVTQNKGNSPLSTKAILDTIKKKTGADLTRIPGYSGAYEMAQAAAPAAATAGLVPELGLLSTTGKIQKVGGTPARLATEGLVAAGTGQVAQSVAPDSPLAQIAIGTTPYAAKGLLSSIQNRMVAPKGTISPDTLDLFSVGRMTPGEATGSRQQLATEARVESSPKIESTGTAFRQAQAADVEGFLSNLFKRSSSSAIEDPQTIANTLSNAFQNYGKALSSKLSKQANADFAAAEKAGGTLDTTPIISKVQELRNTLRPDIPGDSVLASKLDAILENLVVKGIPEQKIQSSIVNAEGSPAQTTTIPAVPAGAKEISVADLKRALSEWSKTAYSGEYTLNGSNIFEGVAPGQAKGIARAVLNGYRDALTAAIDQGVPGASQLKKARDNFAANLKQIDEFADRPIVKAFGKPISQLVPETDVIPVLQKMPQTQRQLLTGIMQDQAPQMMDTIRSLQFKSVLESAQAKNPAANAPTFVIDEALKQMNQKKGDFSFLFSDAKDAGEAVKAMKWMRQVLQSESPASTGLAGNAAYTAARASGGTTQAAQASKGLVQGIKDILTDPVAFSKVIFDPETVNKMVQAQAKPTTEKYLDALTAIGKTAAKQAVIAPRMANPVQPVDEQQQPVDPIEEEMRKRGLL